MSPTFCKKQISIVFMMIAVYRLWVMSSLLWLSTDDHTLAAQLTTQSGLKMWVDPDTPKDCYTWATSRGETWTLVMSDEFNTPGRSFKPGDDHIWTSIEKPDGVNDAMEVYAHNKTFTACNEADGVCSFQIEVEDSITELHVWNSFLKTPNFENVTFFYRGGMIQSWNKFCFQGGMVEVRAQLPGAMSEASGNPDIHLNANARAQSLRFYPTWPGIWMLGNLGRAIFSGSTNRMWPFSYDACEPDVLPPNNQRISACNPNPGSGMHPHQGRGAPEIDLVEGGGTSISASIQVGPGMPPEFRVIPPSDESKLCIYSSSCKTLGANVPGIPESVYLKARHHQSWYQNIRYAANNFCQQDASEVQRFAMVKAALRAGIEDNVCSVTTCPASLDINCDLDYINADTGGRWGINSNGTCFSARNSYMGDFICSAGNTDPRCNPVKNAPTAPKGESPFAFQMDALSANWPVHMAVYTDYVKYQVEWVLGTNGYIRWMIASEPLYEISANTITNPPQGANVTNPSKIMIEEPMYVIFNVAMSSKWGAQPPNPKHPCRGNGLDPVANAICDAFPLYLKIDYIRVYQDLSTGSTMSVGCDPKTHPTRQWILDHLDEYEDEENKLVEVHGKAFCHSDADCTVQTPHDRRRNFALGSRKRKVAVVTGRCVKQRCECTSKVWAGPRCIVPATSSAGSFGPPVALAACIGSLLLLVGITSSFALCFARQKRADAVESERKVKQQQRHQFELIRRQSSYNLQGALGQPI